MLVQQILNSRPNNDVVTITADLLVSEAAAILAEKGFGALIISADGKKIDGILSERDIVRELGRDGADCLGQTVGSIMTKNIVTCARGDTTNAVLSMMSEGRFRHVPVVENNLMVGLISIGDVVKARLSELSMEKDAMQDMIMGH